MPAMGTLYGIGVGPGDPDLITVKALEVLRRVPRIFAAGSSKNDYSIAMDITRYHIRDAEIEFLPFPMTKDRRVLGKAWRANAEQVMEALESGSDAAFVTIGDPSTYSTYGYLLKAMTEINGDLRAVTIPGITSYCAAAAAANIPLCEAEESCHLISGVFGGDKLREVVETSENVVMLKTYRHFDDICETLEELDLLDVSTCVSRCGHADQTVNYDLTDLKGRKVPYLSLLLIKNGKKKPHEET